MTLPPHRSGGAGNDLAGPCHSAPANPAGGGQELPVDAWELAPLGTSAADSPIRLFGFPGVAEETALILGGVHGSERSGVEAAWRTVGRLASGAAPHWTTYAVPCLFPDNLADGRREGSVPTNRNFPAPGESLSNAAQRGGSAPVDSLGVPILPENRMLMALIGRIKPRRVVSLHATAFPERAGIFADAHTLPGPADSAEAAAARTHHDAELAMAMARHAQARGARVAGNRLDGIPTALWSGETPAGTSLGGWAPAPIAEGGAEDRLPITLITVEVDGLADSKQAADPLARAVELEAHADAIMTVFLEHDPIRRVRVWPEVVL